MLSGRRPSLCHQVVQSLERMLRVRDRLASGALHSGCGNGGGACAAPASRHAPALADSDEHSGGSSLAFVTVQPSQILSMSLVVLLPLCPWVSVVMAHVVRSVPCSLGMGGSPRFAWFFLNGVFDSRDVLNDFTTLVVVSRRDTGIRKL